MSGGLLELKSVIEAQRKKVAALSHSRNEILKRAAAIEADVKAEIAKLNGLESALEIVGRSLDVGVVESTKFESTKFEHITDTETKHRRMRMGAKKRFVFSLISIGQNNLGSIAQAVKTTDIDMRFVRDCLRVSVRDGELAIDDDINYEFTEFGRELFEKAPLPKDWSNYSALLRKEEPRGSSETESVSPLHDILS